VSRSPAQLRYEGLLIGLVAQKERHKRAEREEFLFLVVVRLYSRHPFIAVLQSKWAAEYLIEEVLLIQSANCDPLGTTVLVVELP